MTEDQGCPFHFGAKGHTCAQRRTPNPTARKVALKPCRRCGGPKERGMNRQLCDKCRNLTAWHRKPRDKPRHREWRYQRLYGISVEDYDANVAMHLGKCCICRQECESGMRLAVDHDHRTGQVRCVLCRRCNQVLGLMDENANWLQRMAEYVEIWS